MEDIGNIWNAAHVCLVVVVNMQPLSLALPSPTLHAVILLGLYAESRHANLFRLMLSGF